VRPRFVMPVHGCCAEDVESPLRHARLWRAPVAGGRVFRPRRPPGIGRSNGSPPEPVGTTCATRSSGPSIARPTNITRVVRRKSLPPHHDGRGLCAGIAVTESADDSI